MANKTTFKKIYFIFLGILVLIMAVCLIHVAGVLREYERSQPENVAIEQFKIMQKAAKEQKLDSLFNEYCTEELSDEIIAATKEKLISAGGKLTSKLTENSQGGETLTYTVLSGDERIADITLSSKGEGKTKLALFSMTEWEVRSMSPAAYTYDLTLPASMTVLLDGNAVEGTETETNGRLNYYFSSMLEEPDIVVMDSIGAEMNYRGINKLNITEYVVQIPSNYSISSVDGSYTVSPDTATTTDIDDYKYVAQYTEMPKTATYRLGIFGESPDFIITDNLGGKVDYTLDGHTVKIEGQESLAEIPEEVYSENDVLSHARKWSLFMTADLGGAKYGYGQIEEFLLPDSYLMEVAHNWATGVDITFTSVHTLDNPPFSEESVSGYVKYSDICFSVDVKLTKIMHLNSGADVTDTMNCRFYYIKKDGVWYVADIQEIIG